MQSFYFSCGREMFTTEAETAVAAMGIANREFLDKLDGDVYPGAWVEGISDTSFRWVTGNFFD